MKPEQLEIARLKREVIKLKAERDIQKNHRGLGPPMGTATYLGQAIGWYQAGENAGFIGAIVGAIIVLVVWGFIAPRFERT